MEQQENIPNLANREPEMTEWKSVAKNVQMAVVIIILMLWGDVWHEEEWSYKKIQMNFRRFFFFIFEV